MMNILSIKEISNNNRIIGLDVLRSIAIILVLIAHGKKMIPVPIPEIGTLGVDLFFILSGFLIGTILIQIFNNSAGLKGIKNFLIRRWFRTLPNYYLFLLGNIIIGFLTGSLTLYFLEYFAFLQCLTFRVTPIMGESWSLCIEEWFYLIFPVWLLMFSFFFARKKKMILLAIVLFILFFTVLRIGFFYNSVDRSWDFGYKCTTLLRLDSIAYGVFCAWVNRFYKTSFVKFKNIFLTCGIIGLLLTVILYMLQPSDFFQKVFIFSLTNMSFSLLIPFFTELKIRHKSLNYAIAHTSIISYSVYLIHHSFVLRFLEYIYLPTYISYFLYWFLSFLISTIVYNIYEKRMTSLRNRVSLQEVNMSHRIRLMSEG